MNIMIKMLKVIFMILFIESISLILPVIFIACFGDLNRTLKYLIPCLIGFIPFIVIKIIKLNIQNNIKNIILIILLLIISTSYLLYLSGLSLITCAGHPPY
jgi:hypothetical protein